MSQNTYVKGERIEVYRGKNGELIIPALPIEEKIRAEGLKEARIKEDPLNMTKEIILKFKDSEKTILEIEKPSKLFQEFTEP